MKTDRSDSGGKKYFIANWKMNPSTIEEAISLLSAYKTSGQARIVVCPPAVYLRALSAKFKKRFSFGAQNAFWERSGAYTGELSPQMLKASGAEYAIVGHSERRKYLQESDTAIGLKADAVVRAGMRPIVCLGGGLKISDPDAVIKRVILKQLSASVKSRSRLLLYIFAFEPAFAISTQTGAVVSPQRVEQMFAFIRGSLRAKVGSALSKIIPIVYGGSADGKSARGLLERTSIDGFLVGGASLRPKEFNQMTFMLK